MSYGLVVCDKCHREVHQDAVRQWYHCEDATPICLLGTAVYPKSTAEIVGRYCGHDAMFDDLVRQGIRPRSAKC